MECIHLSHDIDAYAGAGKASQIEKAAELRVRVDIGLFADAFEQDEADNQRAEDTDKDGSRCHGEDVYKRQCATPFARHTKNKQICLFR